MTAPGPVIPPMHCEYCGAEIEDPGMGFIDHMDENPDCAEQYDAQSDAAIKDSGNFVDL